MVSGICRAILMSAPRRGGPPQRRGVQAHDGRDHLGASGIALRAAVPVLSAAMRDGGGTVRLRELDRRHGGTRPPCRRGTPRPRGGSADRVGREEGPVRVTISRTLAT